jgi:hypothetical protein
LLAGDFAVFVAGDRPLAAGDFVLPAGDLAPLVAGEAAPAGAGRDGQQQAMAEQQLTSKQNSVKADQGYVPPMPLHEQQHRQLMSNTALAWQCQSHLETKVAVGHATQLPST